MSKKAKKATTTTAIARRPRTRRQSASNQTLMRVRVNDPDKLLMIPEQPPVPLGLLTSDPSVSNLGLVEVKLTPEEEKALSKPVVEREVLIKPTGQPYLPHRVYTAWFNEAFGRFGWSIVQRALPQKAALDKEGSNKSRQLVLVPFLFYVHRQPVAFAWGEQEYSESNAEQTYGDAVEATVANALRRCAKRIGVGLELWDRDWLETWRRNHAIQVKVKHPRDSKPMRKWRRKSDQPFPYEIGASKADDRDDDAGAPPPGDESRLAPRPPAGNDGNDDAPITQPQRQRLATIAKKAGRIDAEVALWLTKKWRYKSSKEIKRKDYDAICRELEARGDLVIPGDGGEANG